MVRFRAFYSRGVAKVSYRAERIEDAAERGLTTRAPVVRSRRDRAKSRYCYQDRRAQLMTQAQYLR